MRPNAGKLLTQAPGSDRVVESEERFGGEPMSESAWTHLLAMVEAEVAKPASDAARRLSDEIRARHGDAVASVLFYGSCLRKDNHEGVLDFYVLVDSYLEAYDGRRGLSIGNAILPPNVFYLELPTDDLGTLRTKYAVVSSAQFAKLVSPACLHPYIWARFAQPSLLVYVRDEEARDHAVRCAAQAVVTLVQRLAPFLPATGRTQRFSLAAFWQSAFGRTYGAERRPESDDSIRGIYAADSERYDAAAANALAILAEQGVIEEVSRRASAVEVTMSPLRRFGARLRWRLCGPIAKALAMGRLIKTAKTFGDWVPYVVWKIERHTGTRLQLTERQREHPLIFAWPVFWRLLTRGDLR